MNPWPAIRAKNTSASAAPASLGASRAGSRTGIGPWARSCAAIGLGLLLEALSGCRSTVQVPTFRVGPPTVVDAADEGRDNIDVRHLHSAATESTRTAAEADLRASEAGSEPTETASIAAPWPTAADDRRVLSIEQAVILALSNNRSLRVQQLAPVIVGAFEDIAEGQFDPELFADGTVSFERASQTARATGERFDVEGQGTNAQIGLRQRLTTGTTIEAALQQQLDDSDRTPAQQVARLSLTVTQSLLRGLGPAVNLASIRQAAFETQASLYQLQAFTEALLASVEVAYWRFVLAQEEINIFEKALDVAREERAQVESRIEVGQLPELEAAAARVEEARRFQALIDAQSRLEAARLNLDRLVSAEPRGRLTTAIETTTDPRKTRSVQAQAQDRLALAERYRPEILEAKLRLEQNRLQTELTENGLLPQLDLFVALRKTGFAENLRDAFGNLTGANTFDFIAGLNLSHFLLNRAGSAQDRAALAGRDQARASIANLTQMVHLEVLLALNELARAKAQIRASTETRKLQARSVAAEKERFDVGASTALLVAQAQRDLLETQIAEVRAIVDYRTALVQLYRAEGTLLARRGISVGAPSR